MIIKKPTELPYLHIQVDSDREMLMQEVIDVDF